MQHVYCMTSFIIEMVPALKGSMCLYTHVQSPFVVSKTEKGNNRKSTWMVIQGIYLGPMAYEKYKMRYMLVSD